MWFGKQVSLVLYVDARDSPRDAYEAAKLAVAYKNKGKMTSSFVIVTLYVGCLPYSILPLSPLLAEDRMMTTDDVIIALCFLNPPPPPSYFQGLLGLGSIRTRITPRRTSTPTRSRYCDRITFRSSLPQIGTESFSYPRWRHYDEIWRHSGGMMTFMELSKNFLFPLVFTILLPYV